MAMPTTRTALTVAGSRSTVPRRTVAKEVAVIGAGAAGLAAAREMRREGHRVVVFERGDSVGGTWVYTPEVESDDLLGVDPKRMVVQTSLYRSLRTNLPREVMGFFDYPFKEVPGRDGRRFPGHEEVLAYLSDFARDFNLVKCIRFKTDVFHVSRVPDGKWLVQSRKVFDDDVSLDTNELFDGVLVCNGHYTDPRIADIPGVDRWPGKQIHSHNYRVPESFQGCGSYRQRSQCY